MGHDGLRIGLAGCGAAALEIHLPILARLPGVVVAAVAETDPARRARALERVPSAIAVGRWEQLLDRDDLDAVVLCLPSGLHAEAARLAVERGLHVYLEKPLATTTADAAGVVEAWRGSGVVGMMGFNYRFNRLYRSASRLLEEGALGSVVAARSVFAIAGDLPAWKRSRAEGGGALLDLAPHHVDLVRFLFDSPIREVFAEVRSVRTEEDTAVLEIRLADGTPVQSFFSLTAAEEERFEVYGRDGKLVVDRSRHQDVVVESPWRKGARLRRWRRAAGSVRHAPYVLEKRRTPGHEPSYRSAFESFVAAVESGTGVRPDFEDGLANVEILAAAERSARSGRAVEVETP